MSGDESAAKNRAHWDAISDTYQERHGGQLARAPLAWGAWSIPEDRLRLLGDVCDKDVLEMGCGGAQWSIALSKRGARCIGLDNSAHQLEHARRNMREANANFPLVHAAAEAVPFPDASFDIIFCDHGAMSFADPYRTVPEAALLLRPGGLLAFSAESPLHFICWDEERDCIGTSLRSDYFDRKEFDDGQSVCFSLPYGEWIALFRSSVGSTSTYNEFVTYEWARRWPAENLWRVVRAGVIRLG